jgi:hypothetical protein
MLYVLPCKHLTRYLTSVFICSNLIMYPCSVKVPFCITRMVSAQDVIMLASPATEDFDTKLNDHGLSSTDDFIMRADSAEETQGTKRKADRISKDEVKYIAAVVEPHSYVYETAPLSLLLAYSGHNWTGVRDSSPAMESHCARPYLNIYETAPMLLVGLERLSHWNSVIDCDSLKHTHSSIRVTKSEECVNSAIINDSSSASSITVPALN